MLIDGAMRKLFNQEYDDNGQTSKKGILNEQVLRYLLADEYYKLPYPKSTGREYFNDEYLEKAIKMIKDCGSDDTDVITTLTYLTAIHLTKSIKRFFPNLDKNSKIFLNGGGAHNSHLVEIIRANIPQEVIIGAGGNEELVDAKEAMSFAVLAHLTLNHKPGNVTTVTGAKEEVVLGSVIFAPRKE
jgi:anhydro-N-acetylmuramic acid kinase